MNNIIQTNNLNKIQYMKGGASSSNVIKLKSKPNPAPPKVVPQMQQVEHKIKPKDKAILLSKSKARAPKHATIINKNRYGYLKPEEYNLFKKIGIIKVNKNVNGENIEVEEETSFMETSCGKNIGFCSQGKYCNAKKACVDIPKDNNGNLKESNPNFGYCLDNNDTACINNKDFRLCLNNADNSCITMVSCKGRDKNLSCAYLHESPENNVVFKNFVADYGSLKLEKQHKITGESNQVICGKNIGVCDPGRYCTKNGQCVNEEENHLDPVNTNKMYRLCAGDDTENLSCKKNTQCVPDSCITKIACGIDTNANNRYLCRIPKVNTHDYLLFRPL